MSANEQSKPRKKAILARVMAQTMSKDQYKSGKDVCVKQAKARFGKS